jgi:hypothetical protein
MTYDDDWRDDARDQTLSLKPFNGHIQMIHLW